VGQMTVVNGMPDTETGDYEKQEPWRGMDLNIWAHGPSSRAHRLARTLREALTISSIWMLVIGGPFTVLVTLAGAYYIGGSLLFGPVLLVIWSILILSFVLVLEKTGYDRNFEAWDFRPTKGLVGLFFAFALYLGLFYLLVTFFRGA